MTHFIVTPKGDDWMERLSWDEAMRLGTVVGDALELLHETAEEGSQVPSPNAGKRTLKAFQYALDRNYIEIDRRSPDQIIGDVGRYNRDLGSLLRTYHRVAQRKPVDDVELNEALLIGLERIEGGYWPEANKAMESALRSKNRGDKIAALDKWIQMVHREGILWNVSKGREPDRIARDVAIILDRLAVE